MNGGLTAPLHLAITNVAAYNRVPLIQSAPVSEFGDFEPDESFFDPNGQDRDATYVPGYAEMRKAFEVGARDFRLGKISRDAIPTVPVRLRWARCQRINGEPDNTKPFSHSQRGYEYVTKEHVGQAWLKKLPGGTNWDAAGNLRRGDSVLMVADAKDAARNDYQKARRTQERIGAVENSFTQNLQERGIRENKGTDPYVERVPTPKKQKET